MIAYLVGGAVRDELLGLPVVERDWVVVGSTPAQMLERGFVPLHGSFPVYRHPRSGDEYALARRERKIGSGHSGFEVDAGKDVTLAEDLARRDLTINAMARSEADELVDPFGGLRDLGARRLSHITDAFTEDPLRLLRCARFAASLSHLGFRIAPATAALMHEMAARDELDTLSNERMWSELDGALASHTPGVFFQVLFDCDAACRLLPELAPVMQTSSLALIAVARAAAKGADAATRFAVLLSSAFSSATDYDTSGVTAVCSRLHVPTSYRRRAERLLQWTKPIIDAGRLTEPARLVDLLEMADAFRRPNEFEALLDGVHCLVNPLESEMQSLEVVRHAYALAKDVRAVDVADINLRGASIGRELKRLRIAAICNGLGQ